MRSKPFLLAVLGLYIWFHSEALLCQEPPNVYPREADFGISGVFLNFRKSSEALLGKDFILVSYPGDREALTCLNRDRTQVAVFIRHFGRQQNAFDEFQVWDRNFYKEENPTHHDPACVLESIEEFVSSRSIKLGISISQLTSDFGNSFRVTSKALRTTVRYRLENNLISAFLQHYRALSYYGDYTFEGNKLIYFAFGLKT